jgi:hypothetical protein
MFIDVIKCTLQVSWWGNRGPGRWKFQEGSIMLFEFWTLIPIVIGYGVMIAVAIAVIRLLNALTRKFDREK